MLFALAAHTGKQKSLHALALVPSSDQGPEALSSIPEGSTPSPYDDALEQQQGKKRQQEVSSVVINCHLAIPAVQVSGVGTQQTKTSEALVSTSCMPQDGPAPENWRWSMKQPRDKKQRGDQAGQGAGTDRTKGSPGFAGVIQGVLADGGGL